MTLQTDITIFVSIRTRQVAQDLSL
ncbi:unnamed protein product [Fusarium graminearum]|nr:unnamed protein product [Fusarium graminearum]